LSIGRHQKTNYLPDTPFKHNYTYSGHPACCAAAFATLEIMEREKIIDQAAAVGQKILFTLASRLTGLPLVKDVRGIGLMNGVELTEEKAVELEKSLLKEEHIISHSNKVGNVLQVVPSVVITDQELEKLVSGIERQLIKFGGTRK
jgi:adenosylmethionine-8-amino-7-oxononanoate aminotransferase